MADAQGHAFFKALAAAATFKVRGDTLQLRGRRGGLLVAFVAVRPAALAGTAWSAVALADGEGGLRALAPSSEITAVFGADGRLGGCAGVNLYGTSCSAGDGGALTVDPRIVSTAMAGPPEPMAHEQACLSSLPRTASHLFVNGELWLRDAAGAPLVRLVARQTTAPRAHPRAVPAHCRGAGCGCAAAGSRRAKTGRTEGRGESSYLRTKGVLVTRSADWVDRAAYPFTSRYLETPAGRMHYIDEGRGEPVVMVHGNPAWSFLYRDLVKRLSSRHRCVAPDHLGFGLSDAPQGWSYLPQDHAANLATLIDHLGLRDITLVVQDWGGPIGLSYAVARPENVARLVIMNTWLWPVDRDPYYVAFSGFMGGPSGRWLILRRNFFAATMMPRLFGDRARLTDAAHLQYLAALPTPQEREGCAVLPRQIVAASAWLEELRAGVPALQDKPVLIAWGMKDIAFRRKELRRWEETFPEAWRLELSGAGHFVQEEAPDELATAVLRFLAATPGGAASRGAD